MLKPRKQATSFVLADRTLNKNITRENHQLELTERLCSNKFINKYDIEKDDFFRSTFGGLHNWTNPYGRRIPKIHFDLNCEDCHGTGTVTAPHNIIMNNVIIITFHKTQLINLHNTQVLK